MSFARKVDTIPEAECIALQVLVTLLCFVTIMARMFSRSCSKMAGGGALACSKWHPAPKGGMLGALQAPHALQGHNQ